MTLINNIIHQKTILFDLTGLYDHITGIERYAMEISHAMIVNKPENRYILLFKNEIHGAFSDVAAYENVECHILKSCNKLIFNQIVLPLELYKYKADAFVFLAFPVPVMFFNSKIYTTIHDMGCFDCGDNMKSASKWYFRISDYNAAFRAYRILTISKFSGKRIADILKVNPKRMYLIGCAVTNQDSRWNENLDGKADSSNDKRNVYEKYHLPERYMLSLSTLEPRKNLKLLLRTCDLLLKDGVNIPDLVLAGRMGWKMDEFMKGYSKKLCDKVHCIGFVDDFDLPEVYGNAEFFVFPSMYEGFGIPPLEAMNYLTPVLSSDAASMPEVLGDAAMYFKSEDINSFKTMLIKMINLDKESIENLINKGKERVKLYSWEKEALKLEERIKIR